MPQPTRVIAQDILTKRFLHWDLPVSDLTIQWSLSGPTVISGEFPVELRELADLGLDAWSCWLHVEEDGIIRASGILQPAQLNEEEKLSVEALGPMAYLQGTPFMGAFTVAGTDPASGESGVGIGIDPADILRAIWADAQKYNANLGITVVGATDTLRGTPKRDVSFTATTGTDGQTGTPTTEQVDFSAGPYTGLQWWDAPDLGSEWDKIAKDTPLDYVERCAWNAARTDVVHYVELGYPRIGGAPSGVRFAEGENIDVAPGPEEPDDRYASRIVVLGRGEGTARIRGEASRSLGNRIPRTKVLVNKTIESKRSADALALDELNRCQALADLSELTALARHDNACLGSYAVGDDVPVFVDAPWHGQLQLIQRVLSIAYNPDREVVKLGMRAASSFTY